MYIMPPRVRPSLSVPLYITDSVPSWYFVHMPIRALTHIQKMAPGPPTVSAMATPAMLPRPTVAAMADARACTDEIWPVFSSPLFTRSALTAAGRRRSDTAPERMNR